MYIQAQNGKFYDNPMIEKGSFIFAVRYVDTDELLDNGVEQAPCLVLKERSLKGATTAAFNWLKEQGIKAKVDKQYAFQSDAIIGEQMHKALVFPLILGGPIPVPTSLIGPVARAFTKYAWSQTFPAPVLQRSYDQGVSGDSSDREMIRYIWNWLCASNQAEYRVRLLKALNMNVAMLKSLSMDAEPELRREFVKAVPPWVPLI